jgi:uncharacterized protein YdeI (YjbR/CyaY-like superfamily)
VKTDPRVDSYIERAAPFARPILRHVRSRVHALAPEAEETLKWSMPSFTIEGKILVSMAAFKAHAVVSFWRGEEIGIETSNDAMGQLGKLKSIGDLPPAERFDALILKGVELARTAPASRKTRHQPRPTAVVHPEFASALAAAPKAREVLDGFSPSAQREYLDWVSEAKLDSTRQKRIAEAIEWLSEGKRRHWKYEKC